MLEIARILSLTPEQTVAITEQSARDWREWGTLLNVETHEISSVVLPETDAEDGQSALAEHPAPLPAIRPMRILVADDDDTLTFMINKLLTAAGHTVYVARDGREALRLRQREPAALGRPHHRLAQRVLRCALHAARHAPDASTP